MDTSKTSNQPISLDLILESFEQSELKVLTKFLSSFSREELLSIQTLYKNFTAEDLCRLQEVLKSNTALDLLGYSDKVSGNTPLMKLWKRMELQNILEEEKASKSAENAEPVLTDCQKARERKAIEKALLKEFAAQQLGTEEQQELRRARLKTLIKMGMSKGYLTHGEMNDVMSDELSDADALETLVRLLEDIKIKVYKNPPSAEELIQLDSLSPDKS